MPYSIRLPDGTLVQNIPDSLTPEQAKAKIIKEMPQYGAADRTWGEAATDIGAAGLKGIGSLAQLPGQLYGLTTGDFSKTGMYGAGKDLEDYGQSLKSQGLQTREARAQQATQEAEKQGQFEAFKTSLGQTISDPALLSTFLAEQVPQLLPALVTGGGSAALTSSNVLAKAAARKISEEAAKKVAQREAIRVGTSAAIGTGAVQQGADVGTDTYDNVVKHLVETGATPEQASKAAINLARAAGVTGAALSVIANRYLPGGQALERVLAGGTTGKGIIGGAVTGAVKELPSELLEETGGQLAKNIALRQVNPQQSLTEGLGATAAQAGLGAVGLGGITGAVGGRGAAPEVKTEPSTEEKLAGTTTPSNSPIVATTKVNVDGKESTKITRQDGSVDIDGVQVTPPTGIAGLVPQAEEGETSLEDILAKGTPKAEATTKKAAAAPKAVFPPDSLEFLDQRIAEKQDNYDKQQTEIERKQAINQNPKNQIVKNQQVAAEIAAMEQARDARLAKGETYATRTEQGAGGEGAAVSGPAASTTDTAGLETPQRDGVVPPEQNADQLATGEAGKPAAITDQQTGAPIGTQTTETVKAETQEQKAPAAPVTPPAATPVPFTYRDAGSGDTHFQFNIGNNQFLLSNSGGKPQFVVRDSNGNANIFYAEGKKFDGRPNIFSAAELPTMYPGIPAPVITAVQTWLSSSGKEKQVLGAKVADALNTVVSPKTAKPAATPAAPVKTAAQQYEDLLNSIFGDDGLASKGTARRTKAQIEQDEKLDKQLNTLGKRYGLVRSKDETQREFGQRIRNAVTFEKDREGKPLSAMSSQDIAAQQLKEPKGYFPAQEQRDLYDETRQDFNDRVDEKIATGEATEDDKLPAYKELSDDERRTYFQDHISRNSQDEHDKAVAALAEYISNKRFESRAAPKDETLKKEAADQVRVLQSYARERAGFGSKTSINYLFPGWSSLSDASRALFTSINKTDTVLEQDMAFRAIKEQIQKEKLEEQSREKLQESESRARQEMLAAAERARAGQPSGKGDVLPDNILKKLFAGDIKAVLDYIAEQGNGLKLKTGYEYQRVKLKNPPKNASRMNQGVMRRKLVNVRDSVAMSIFRGLAQIIGNIEGLRVNVVFDENMTLDNIAEYNANTNTLYVGPNGLDEATILHELVHAATVKIIHQYFTDKTKLDPRAAKAVEHLQNIAAVAKKVLGSKHPNAFDNLYEFVAYAMTDFDFQFELSKIQVPRLAIATAKTETQSEDLRIARETEKGATQYDSMFDNLWDYFTGTLAYMYRLFTPSARQSKILLTTEKTNVLRGKTKKEDVSQRAEAEIKSKKLIPEEVPEGEKTLADAIQEKKAEASQEALNPAALFDTAEEKKDAVIPPIKGELVAEKGVTNLVRGTLQEPGYKGNLLLEAAAMLQDILAAPEGGIQRLAGREGIGAQLPSKGTAKTTKAPKSPAGPRSPEQIEQEQEAKLPTENTVGNVRKTLTSTPGLRRLATVFANSRYPIKVWEDALQRAKKTIDAGPTLNNIYTQITLSIGKARDLYLTHVERPASEMQNALGEYMKASAIDSQKALARLHTYFMALHEPERRAIKYLLNVPLSTTPVKIGNQTIAPSDFREQAISAVDSGTLTPKQLKTLRTALDGVVKSYVDPAGVSPAGYKSTDVNSTEYNVIGELSPTEVKAIKDKFDSDPAKAQAEKVIAAMRQLNDATKTLNQMANYWSAPVQSRVDFYNWQNYIPFKGKEVAGAQDGMLDFDVLKTRKTFADKLQDYQASFEGRESWSDNSLTQVMSDATRAAMRAGRKDLTLSIKNAIKQGLLIGDINKLPGLDGKSIPFADRDKIDLSSLKGETTIFHYNEDGSIDILQVRDENQRNAIRRTYQQSNPLIDMLNQVTSGIGQFHTRYNIAFAPMNYFRDALTNAFAIGTEMDKATAAQYIGAVASQVVNGGMWKTWNIARLYNEGKMDELKAYIAKDKSGFAQDAMEYIKAGGMVSYLQGVSTKGTFKSLQRDINSSNPKKALDGMSKFFDAYTDMFELSSRTAAYRVTRNKMIAEEKLSPEAAQTRAAAYVKNLANFEQSGEWGRGAGAFFMFFRPAATGALRAIETLGPMLRSTDAAIADLPPEVRKDKKAVEEFRKSHEKQGKNAQAMTMALAGFGAAMYLMSMALSDDDDYGRNRTATDDINRWSRYARFFIPGMENPIQIPWGYGLGAFAAAGGQVMGMATGNASLKDGMSNIVSIGLDSFLPLPISRINMLDNFPAFLMDSALPSAARPFLEWQMNMDALGREIYNNRQSRVGDAYTGGDNIPELYKSAARTLADVTNGAVDVSPNTMYFFANSYIDGLSRVAQTGQNMLLLGAGEKAFNPKTDTVLFDSFFGAPSNFDARQFSTVETQVKEKERKLNMFKSNPEKYADYTAANPMDEYLVKEFNHLVGGELQKLRKEANDYRKMPNLTPKERKEMIDNIVAMQNMTKQRIIETFKLYDVNP